jgi:two-component system, NtrC family, sensor kinase
LGAGLLIVAPRGRLPDRCLASTIQGNVVSNHPAAGSTSLNTSLRTLHEWAARECGAQGTQIWVSDDLGFHPRASLGRAVDHDDRTIARRSCIEGQSVSDDSRLSIPLQLSDRRSGSCLFALPAPASESTRAACSRQVSLIQSELDEGLQLQRLTRLSGAARESDQLRTILTLTHTVEHCESKHSVLSQIHGLLKQLIYAENFFVVVLDDDKRLLNFEFFADQYDQDENPIPFVQGGLDGSLSAYVVAAGRVVRGTSQELLSEAGHGDKLRDQHYGPRAHDWLGVPMVVANEVLGAVVIQSYDPQIRFKDVDPSILSMFAEALGAALHQRRIRERLERTVSERTAQLETAKHAAERALVDLRAAQRHLVEAEKMASLGQLVAGVAHEANTPLGVALTANSYLQTLLRELHESVDGGGFTNETLQQFMSVAEQSTSMVGSNLERAARLVQSFKQVSVDRSSEGRRKFELNTFLQELITSISSMWRDRSIAVAVSCEPGLMLDSFPGSLSQALSNLIQNALVHAYSEDQSGTLRIECAECSPGRYQIRVSDDGSGIAPEHLEKIFEPFFTTRRNRGGTGLGLHVVYNLVTHKLGGTIEVESHLGEGSRFLIEIPGIAPGISAG